MDVPVANDLFLFEGFRLDRRGGGLFRSDDPDGGAPVAIGSRALDVLAILVAGNGALVSKDAIMHAVWPNAVVEEKNLTVQISALRRVLDAGKTDRSCIQTEAGRGYRFVAAVTRLDGGDPTGNQTSQLLTSPISADAPTSGLPMRDPEIPSGVPSRSPGARRHLVSLELVSLAVLLLALGFGAAWWLGLGRPVPFHEPVPVHEAASDLVHSVSAVGGPQNVLSPSPRLSLVVLPFENLSGDPKDDYLADGITYDLTTDLADLPGALVVARSSAYSYKGKPADVRRIGDELGVRYVVEGSVRRIESALRVNVQLTSAETGAQLWSDRFDEQITDLAAGQEQVVARMHGGLGVSMVDIESVRSMRDRPTNPDAFDLILRARALGYLLPSLQRKKEALALYERALVLDPSSVAALEGVAFFLLETRSMANWGGIEDMQRAGRLLAQAHEIAPQSASVLETTLWWLRSVGRCQEVIETAQHAIQAYSIRMRAMVGVYNELANCKTFAGHAEEALALQATANRLNPRSPWMFSRYRHMGVASLLLGRDQDAITFLQRSLAMRPEVDSGTQWSYRYLAAAYARTGQIQEARHFISEADRIWPYDTVRSHFPDAHSTAVYAEQVRGFQAALRLAGERDHADEDVDFGVPEGSVLSGDPAGLTPTGVPGAKTIRTADLVRLIAEARPVVIDTVSNSWGRSIRGAVGLEFSGLGGSVSDAAQEPLHRKMQELTGGDHDRPVVAVGWNSERFDGRNLALRLAALGYTRVYWYRGGREAWEVANLPETDLALQEW